jgi:ABC-type lipoprotein release transport system permease subunit
LGQRLYVKTKFATAVVITITWRSTAIPVRRVSRTDPVLVLRGD